MKYGFLSPQTTVGTTNYSVHGRAGLPPGAGVGRATGSDHSGPCICPPARGLQTALQSKGLSRVFTNTSVQSINSSAISFLYSPTPTSIHDYWKNCSLDYITCVGKVMPLLFNMLSRLVIDFLPRSKSLLISWLWSPSSVILEPKKIKSATVPTVSPSICHEVMGPDAMILVFWMLSFKPTCFAFLFHFHQGAL